MILHVVLFRPRAGLEDDERQGLAKAFASAIDEIARSSARGSAGDARTGARTNN